MPPGKVFLGYGKAKDFKAYAGYVLKEDGRRVYAVHKDFYCKDCEAKGCANCKFTGENLMFKLVDPSPQKIIFRKAKPSKSPARQ
jgi:hypothetical protein